MIGLSRPALTRLVAAAALALAAALPARAAIDIEPVTSPGGIDAWLVEDHALPFVALEIRFRGGASLDAEGARGAIHLMTGLLEEGAGERDSQGFATAVESLAARFNFDELDLVSAILEGFLDDYCLSLGEVGSPRRQP